MAIQGTRLETDEEVRQAVMKYRPAAPNAARPPRPATPADDGPPVFRPTQRPSMLLLTVFDDGQADGEVVRIRKERFVIGRTEGDLVIPHDVQMSGKHAELRRGNAQDKGHWHLQDLGSKNGTFVRVGHAVLSHGQEFMLGKSRLRFDNEGARAQPGPGGEQGTLMWDSGLNPRSIPSIVEVAATGDGARVSIQEKEAWLGKDAGVCQVVLKNDPFASLRHARIYQDETGRWIVENNRSVNGVWLRMERLAFKETCRFLLGEQQFMVKFLA